MKRVVFFLIALLIVGAAVYMSTGHTTKSVQLTPPPAAMGRRDADTADGVPQKSRGDLDLQSGDEVKLFNNGTYSMTPKTDAPDANGGDSKQ